MDDPNGLQWKPKALIDVHTPHLIKQYELFKKQ